MTSPMKRATHCPCGNPLAWSDQGGMCQDCRDGALRLHMRGQRPRYGATATDAAEIERDKHDQDQDRKEPGG